MHIDSNLGHGVVFIRVLRIVTKRNARICHYSVYLSNVGAQYICDNGMERIDKLVYY